MNQLVFSVEIARLHFRQKKSSLDSFEISRRDINVLRKQLSTNARRRKLLTLLMLLYEIQFPSG